MNDTRHKLPWWTWGPFLRCMSEQAFIARVLCHSRGEHLSGRQKLASIVQFALLFALAAAFASSLGILTCQPFGALPHN